MDKTDPAADIRLLREEMTTIRQLQPGAKLVCCSTGTSYWLAYDKRLYDNGLLDMIDILSSHPYQAGAPEQRDGVIKLLRSRCRTSRPGTWLRSRQACLEYRSKLDYRTGRRTEE